VFSLTREPLTGISHQLATEKSKKVMVPKKGLLTVLRWNLPAFVVKPYLNNGLGVAC
jgi:hypothetical protein